MGWACGVSWGRACSVERLFPSPLPCCLQKVLYFVESVVERLGPSCLIPPQAGWCQAVDDAGVPFAPLPVPDITAVIRNDALLQSAPKSPLSPLPRVLSGTFSRPEPVWTPAKVEVAPEVETLPLPLPDEEAEVEAGPVEEEKAEPEEAVPAAGPDADAVSVHSERVRGGGLASSWLWATLMRLLLTRSADVPAVAPLRRHGSLL